MLSCQASALVLISQIHGGKSLLYYILSADGQEQSKQNP